MKYLLLLCLLLPGCAVMESSATFGACKAADVATTYYGLHHGFVETNPIVRALLAHGWVPFIAVSVGLYLLIDHFNEPAVTVPANAFACGAAIHNLVLLK